MRLFSATPFRPDIGIIGQAAVVRAGILRYGNLRHGDFGQVLGQFGNRGG